MANKDIVARLMASAANEDEQVARLLAMCVGRVLLKRLNDGDKELPDEDILRHIADWIAAAVVTNAHWLSNFDDHGRPKKLMKFSMIEQITAEADRAMRDAAARPPVFPVIDGDERVYRELGDGFRLVQLLTPEALDRESAVMQHCIGNGGYDRHVTDSSKLYLSLRDRAGKAHATLEVDVSKHTLKQFQGKQNKPPVQRYIDVVVPYLRDERILVGMSSTRLGYVVAADGEWHRLENLPENLHVAGDLDISYSKLTVLPRNLTVDGTLNATGSKLESLPEGLKVRDSIRLARTTGIFRLFGLEEVCKELDLNGSRVQFLPNNLRVGSLDVSHTPMSSLPEGLVVKGTLNISHTDIVELPEDIYVGVVIEAYRTDLETIPHSVDDDVVVYGGPVASSARFFRSGCLAGEMKVKKKHQSYLKRLFGFA
jgi:hypothetical protein